MNRKTIVLAAALCIIGAGCAKKPAEAAPETTAGTAAEVLELPIPYWTKDSAAMKSITGYVAEVTDPSSESFVPEEERIAVFDFDGTLYGELFPTYFDTSLLIHRVLHDDSYEAAEDVKEYAAALEEALYSGQPEPESPRSGAQLSAEAFAGMTVPEYRDYVRAFMQEPAAGFENMTYADGFYRPMTALVQYLAERGFTVFISSGSERSMVRELAKDSLGKWIPPYRIIGSTFSLHASGQGDKAGRSYNYRPEDRVLMEGNLVTKNQKTNKVFSIIDEIGEAPLLVFGNSSGDLAMAEYALQHGGRGYMLLCDDTERDYGKEDVAEAFAEECAKLGLETVSMKDDFATIYGEDVRMTGSFRPSGDADDEEVPAA